MSLQPLIIHDDILLRNFEWLVELEENSYVLSEVFEINLGHLNSKWQVELYCTKDDVHAHMHRVEASCDFRVKFAFGTFGPFVGYDGKKLDQPWIRLCDFNKLVTVNIFIPLDYTSSMATDFATGSLLSNYEKFFNSETLSDIKFNCSDGQVLPAHRLVLAAHSSLLQVWFMMPMSESKSLIYQLDDIDSKTMLEVFRFLYTGKLKKIKILAPNLLYCAEKFQFDVLKKFVIQSMIKMMNCSNVLKYLECAERYSDELLFDFCAYFIKRNYNILCKREDWMKLDFKTKNLLKLFSRREIRSELLKLSVIYGSTVLPNKYKKFP